MRDRANPRCPTGEGTYPSAADQSDIARVSASNPDIAPFIERGGRLILSGGWNNALVPAGYYDRVRTSVGPARAQDDVDGGDAAETASGRQLRPL